MKKLLLVLLTIASLSCISCTTPTTDQGYAMAKAGQYDTSFYYVGTKAELRKATINALVMKKWEVKDLGDAISASLDHRGMSARLYITFAENQINVNSKGSNISGKAIVPIRYINNVKAAIGKQLGSK